MEPFQRFSQTAMGFQLELVAQYRAMEILDLQAKQDDRLKEARARAADVLSQMEAILQTPEFGEAYGKELMALCSAPNI